MQISFDPAKRHKTLIERQVDFLDAPLVFRSSVYITEDTRKDYGENRYICYGYLEGRMVVIGFVKRGETYHIFSMRKANEREQKRYAPILSHGF
jgi:uncharacterized protein